jgi:NAD-dependent deacetylase
MKIVREGRDGETLAEAVRALCNSSFAAALTGAGISVESGIPDFRSPGGLWSVFDPEEYATLTTFRNHPEKAWRLYRALGRTLEGKRPNPAHEALAALEAAGLLGLVVTQNVDGLHQAAGSERVIEIHGDHRHLQCLACGHLEEVTEAHLAAEDVPLCPRCGSPFKPNVVLFEEPVRGLEEIEAAMRRCDLLLVVGTSGLVWPTAGLPKMVKRGGGRVLEFNLGSTDLTESGAVDYLFAGQAGKTLARFASAALAQASPATA